MTSPLDYPIFKDDEAARRHLEAMRWPDGPVCPKCGSVDNATLMQGKSHRPGLYKCKACEAPFSAMMGTVFESSHVPLHKWFIAAYMLCCSKKGCSSKQLERMLGVTYKTAWFMSHRIREAFRAGKDFAPMGGNGAPVEIDETFIGGYRRGKGKGGGVGHKDKIMSIVERGGEIRSFHVASVGQKELRPIIKEQVDASATVYTDEASYHRSLGKDFAKHEVVNHRLEEYVRGDVYTNTLEGYFSILKRGLGGIYQHVSPKHLKRYVGEFDFRYNTRKVTDIERTDTALKGIVGKRLMYRGT